MSDEAPSTTGATTDESGKRQGALLALSSDKMKLFIPGPVPVLDPEAIVHQADEELRILNVSDARRFEAEHRLREALTVRNVLENVELLYGKPPVPPVDGRIEWLGNFFATGFKQEGQTDRVDYRERLAETSVGEGQPLARLVPPVPGVDGETAVGQRIVAPKPKTARLRTGHNVHFDEETQVYSAACGGHIRIQNGHLQVDDVYRITGSIGLETGHVYHPGSLLVDQNIEQGSIVRASGEIVVNGYIEDAKVEAGGNITVRGGISGDQCVCKANGHLFARYIQNATIYTEGDCIVEREIDNAQVFARGAVRAVHGRIAGGQTVALAGIEVHHAGTPLGTPTVLEAGIDYAREERLQQYETRLQSLDQLLAKVHAQVDPILAHHPNPYLLPEAARLALNALTARIEQASESRDRLAEERDAYLEETTALARPIILVTGDLFYEVTFLIARMRLRIRESLRGPLVATPRRDSIRLAQSTATDLRRAIEVSLRKQAQEDDEETESGTDA